MRWVRRLFLIAFFVGALVLGWRLAAENSGLVTIHFLAGSLEGLTLWMALLGAFLVGAATAGLLAFLQLAKLGLVTRRYRKTVKGLEAEVHQLRSLPLSPEQAEAEEGGEVAPASGLERGT
jgi:uncharacterized integral membrane protein